jgi:quinol monooxygenase YgiN
VWVNELYESEAAVDAHEGTARYQAVVGKIGGLVTHMRATHATVEE